MFSLFLEVPCLHGAPGRLLRRRHKEGRETHKSLAFSGLSHLLACLTLPLLHSQVGSVARRADEALPLLSSWLPYSSHTSAQGSAVSLAPGAAAPCKPALAH